MARDGGLSTYRRVLSGRRTGVPFVAATIARLPISMAPLGIVLLVQHVSGSYGRAGTVAGAFAVGTSLGAPVWGRALDRWGQPRVIAPTAALSATLLAVLALASVQGAPLAALLTAGFLAGVTFPPMTPSMRAAWRVALPDQTQVRAAYALDAVAVETIFIVGPLLLSLLLLAGTPALPLFVTSALMLGGGLIYARTASAREAWSHGQRERARPTSPVEGLVSDEPEPTSRLSRAVERVLPIGLLPVLATSLSMAVAFGAIDTSLAATARDVLGNPSQLGFLFAAIAGGSACGGLWFGTRDLAHRRQTRFLPFLPLTFAAGLVPLSILLGESTPALMLLLPLLFFTGLAISPTLIILQNLVDIASPSARVNEGQSWLATSITTGAGVGTAVAGALVDAAGAAWSFAAAGLAALVTAMMAGRLSRQHHRRTWPPRTVTSNWRAS